MRSLHACGCLSHRVPCTNQATQEDWLCDICRVDGDRSCLLLSVNGAVVGHVAMGDEFRALLGGNTR